MNNSERASRISSIAWPITSTPFFPSDLHHGHAEEDVDVPLGVDLLAAAIDVDEPQLLHVGGRVHDHAGDVCHALVEAGVGGVL